MREASSAELLGEQIATERESPALPIDIRAIADGYGVAVVAKPTRDGVSGFFIRAGSSFTIAYSSRLNNVGFERFSIGHELGHLCLPGHVDHVLDADGIHESSAGFTSKDPHEIEADQFSVGLLMPRKLFLPAMEKVPDGLRGVEQLATLCATSLTTTAIRTAECSKESLAVVICRGDRIESGKMSDRFKEMRGLKWLKKGQPIPDRTLTRGFVSDAERVRLARRDDDSTHLHAWFGDGPDIRVTEEVIGLGDYGRTLTILTPEEDPEDYDERKEEEEAEDRSWDLTFKRSRRR